MFERFTDRARRIIVLSQDEVKWMRHGQLDALHLLLGIINEGEGVGALVLKDCGASLDDMRHNVVNAFVQMDATPMGNIPFTDPAKRALDLSLRESLQLGHNYIGTEHLLLGLTRLESINGFLGCYGISYVDVRNKTMERIGEYSRQQGHTVTTFGPVAPGPGENVLDEIDLPANVEWVAINQEYGQHLIHQQLCVVADLLRIQIRELRG